MKYALVDVRRKAGHIRECLPYVVSLKGSTKARFDKAFRYYNAILFVGSVGIIIRLLQNYQLNKMTDPAILVFDEGLKFCIPLLSSHLGGGTEICMKICNLLGCKPVFTTSTDANGVMGPDRLARMYNYSVYPLERIVAVSEKLLHGKVVTVSGELHNMVLPDGYEYVQSGGEIGVSEKGKILTFIPKDLALGVGFHKAISPCEMEERFKAIVPEEARLRINSIATVSDRWKLPVFHEFARRIGALHTRGYSKEEMRVAIDELGVDRDNEVKKYLGISDVAIPSAYILSGRGEHLFTVKDKCVKFSVFKVRDFLWQKGPFEPEEVPESIR